MSTTTEAGVTARKPVNFSRPRFKPKSANEADTKTAQKVDAAAPVNVHTVNAFHESAYPRNDNPLPDEPRFSLDTIISIVEEPGYEDGSEYGRDCSSDGFNFALENKTGLSPYHRGPQFNTGDQRHPGLPRSNSSSGATTRSASTAGAGPSTSPSTADSMQRLMPRSILKHTTVEQYSERASSEAGESARSHHTTSEAGSFDQYGNWTSSEYDTSVLSEKEIRKLKKKGINPSLYLEMKMARKGKSCVGGLTGNAYVS